MRLVFFVKLESKSFVGGIVVAIVVTIIGGFLLNRWEEARALPHLDVGLAVPERLWLVDSGPDVIITERLLRDCQRQCDLYRAVARYPTSHAEVRGQLQTL